MDLSLIKRHQEKMKGGKKKPKAGFIHYTSKPGELVSPRRRIIREVNLESTLPTGRKGQPPKTWKRRFPNEGRNLCQGPLPQRASLPHSARKGASPQPSYKLKKVLW